MITFLSKRVEEIFDYFTQRKRLLIDSDDEDGEIDLHRPPFKRSRHFDRSIDTGICSVNSNRISDVNVFQNYSHISPSSSTFGMANMQNLQKKRIPISIDVIESGLSADSQNKENASSNSSRYFMKTPEGYSTSTKELSSHASKYFGREISRRDVEVDVPLFKSSAFSSFKFEPSLTSTAFKSTSSGICATKRKPLKIDSPRPSYPYNIPLSSKFGIHKSHHKRFSNVLRPGPTRRPSLTSCGIKKFTTKEVRSREMPLACIQYEIQSNNDSQCENPYVHQRNTDLSRSSRKVRSYARSIAMWGYNGFLTNSELKNIRLDEKEKYRRLIQQYTSTSVLPQRDIRSSFFTSTIDGNFASAEASSCGAIVKTDIDPITTSRSRVNLERTELCPIKSATVASRLAASFQLSCFSNIKSSPSVTEVPVIILDSDDPAEEKLEDDIFIIKEYKPASPIKNQLEDNLQKSQYYDPDWLKDIKKNQEDISKIADDDVQVLVDKKKKNEELRRQCEKELMDKVEKRISKLDLTYPRAYIEVPDDEEEDLPELTPEIENIIDRAFKGGPPGQVLADKFNIKITRKDLHTLAGLNWLNDEVINFYMNMLMERGKNDNYPSVYAFNTFFYGKLLKTGYASVKRWTKKVDIFAHDLLIIPVHLGMHWCLATIDFRTKSIKYYDSMLGDNNKCLVELRKYLESEHQDKKKSSFNVGAFSAENIKDIPQQMNGSDCGMFSCKFAEYLSRNAAITFTQDHMPYFRRRMVYEIVAKKLL